MVGMIEMEIEVELEELELGGWQFGVGADHYRLGQGGFSLDSSINNNNNNNDDVCKHLSCTSPSTPAHDTDLS